MRKGYSSVSLRKGRLEEWGGSDLDLTMTTYQWPSVRQTNCIEASLLVECGKETTICFPCCHEDNGGHPTHMDVQIPHCGEDKGREKVDSRLPHFQTVTKGVDVALYSLVSVQEGLCGGGYTCIRHRRRRKDFLPCRIQMWVLCCDAEWA